MDEARRLAELAQLGIMDTDPEPAFDALVRTAALVAGTSSALVGLIDETRQWYKAKFGVVADQVPRDESVCRTVLETDQELVVSDLTQDVRFNQLPAVTAEEPVRFYAGFPLRTSTGAVLGTLCVLDPMPGELDGVETAILRTLADQVMAQIELNHQIQVRNEAVRELAQSEARFRYLVENSLDVIARHRLDGSVVDVSPGVDDLLGLDPAQADSWNLNERVHPDDLEAYGEAFMRTLAGEPTTALGRMRHTDGDWRWLETIMRPILDDDGQVAELLFTTRDATARVAAAQELETAQRQIAERQLMLEEAQALAGVGSWSLDLASGRLTWSDQMHVLFRTHLLPGFELVGQAFYDFLHPEDLPTVQARMQAAIESGQPQEMEYRVVLPDGVERLMYGRARVEFAPDGTPVRVGGSTQDVTEERRRQREVAGARDRFVQLLGAATEQAIVGTDLDGRISLFNKGAERMTGYTAEEVQGRSPWVLLHDQAELAERTGRTDIGEFRRVTLEHNRVAGGSETVQFAPAGTREWTWLRKDGTPIAVQIAITPMRDEEGAPAGNLGVATDVTDQRRAERERDEAMVAISRARDEALAANAAKSAFLATMSHEIRTPMNAVIGMTGILLDSDLSAEQRELLETVRSSGDQLLAIINDILDFSKIESGDLDLESRAFDLRELVEGTVAQFAGSAKGLELASLVDDGAPARVVGDVTRLRQVLSNLMGNAVKFTHEGDVLVRVRLPEDARGEGAPEGVRLRFDVKDSGIGIPAESMHRLFKSFSQVDASTTRTYGGTGLGLAISKALVQAMGGDLWVTSEPGVGSEFSFVLDLPVDEPRADAGTSALAGRRVLVVEDNATVRLVVRSQLESRGAVVVEAGDADQALAHLDGPGTFDLALLDLGLPGRDGATLAGLIRARPGTAGLPLVLLSGLGRRPDDEDRFALVLTKPVRSQTLLDGLARVLSPGSAIPAQAAASPAGTAPATRPLRILLAEDNEVNQRVGSLMLAKLGHTVEIAPNGIEALASAHRTDYDVVLMDMHMPVMDGLEATRRIRAELPPDRQPPIIAMTASVTLEDREACAAAGMDGYLAKPVRAADLDAALSELGSRQPG